jgi:CheY-like chemotaxis protein
VSERSRLPTVLIVDDDMLALSSYRRQLQSEPVYCEFALSGDHAIRHLSSDSPPSVVVTDLLMPSPNGVEVLAAAVQIDQSWNQRFVFVSGAPLDEAQRKLGGRFYGRLLRKPINTDELCRAIRACLALAPHPNPNQAATR